MTDSIDVETNCPNEDADELGGTTLSDGTERVQYVSPSGSDGYY